MSNTWAIVDFANLNPAQINFRQTNHHKLRLLSTGIGVRNNFMNLANYRLNFDADPDWDIHQKTELFNLIPPAGAVFNTDLLSIPLQFESRYLNLSVSARHYANLNLTRDLFDIALFGNSVNRVYDFSGSRLHSINYLDAALGVSYPVLKNILNIGDPDLAVIKQLNLGARLHYQKGLFLTQTDSSTGYVSTTPDLLLARAELYQSVAQNADCYALDIGASALLPNNVIFGFAVYNLNTGFSWHGNPHQLCYQINIDTFSIQRYLNVNQIDSFYQTLDSNTPITAFTTKLPTQILLSFQYQPYPLFGLEIYYHQYLKPSVFIQEFDRSLQISFNLQPIRILKTSFSITSDLKNDFRIGHTLGLSSRNCGLELGLHQENGYFNTARGLYLGVSFVRYW